MKKQQPFYRTLWGQVLAAVAIAIVLGHFRPDTGIAMKVLGDAFIRAISMIITVVIFCTVVTGIAFGLVAVVIGIAVGKGIIWCTGGKRARALQVLSVALSALTFVYASYLVNRTFILREYNEGGLSLPFVPGPALLFEVVRAGFDVMDLVFLGITVYEAWRIPAPFKLKT